MRGRAPGDGAVLRSDTAGRVCALLIDALASFRLVKLIRDDRVAEPLRAGVERRYGGIEESKVAYLLQCPWCLSFWFGLALTLGHRRWPGSTRAVTHTLAVSALTGLLVEESDRRAAGAENT